MDASTSTPDEAHQTMAAASSSGLVMHGAISDNQAPSTVAQQQQESSTNSWMNVVGTLGATGTNDNPPYSSLSQTSSVNGVVSVQQHNASEDHGPGATTSVATVATSEQEPSGTRDRGQDANEQQTGTTTNLGSSKTFSGKRTLESGEEVAPFVSKLKMVLDDPQTDHIVRWRQDGGTGFEILRPADLASQVLPRMFRAANATEAFTRQLKGYGFQYMGSPGKKLPQSRAFDTNDSPIYYENENFYKDMAPRLLAFVRPRSALKKMKAASGSRPESATTKIRDVEENGDLSRSDEIITSTSKPSVDKQATVSSKEAAKSPHADITPYWPAGTEVTPDQAKHVCKSMEKVKGLPLNLCAAAYFEESGLYGSARDQNTWSTTDIASVENYVFDDKSNSFPTNCYRMLLEATIHKNSTRNSLGLSVIEATTDTGVNECYFVGGVAQNTFAAACRPELLAIEFPRGKEPKSSIDLGCGAEFDRHKTNGGIRIPRKQLRIQPGDRIVSVAGWSVEGGNSSNPVHKNVIDLLQAPMSTQVRIVLERWSLLMPE